MDLPKGLKGAPKLRTSQDPLPIYLPIFLYLYKNVPVNNGLGR